MAARNKYDDPDYSGFIPVDTWTEILPGLWQGGTDDDDIVGRELAEPRITRDMFDTVVTLHAWSNPVDWHVREIRQAFHDGDVDEFDQEDVSFLASLVLSDWSAGKRVGVRCLSGLNRSGLIVGLVLIRAGYEPQAAIDLMRSRRSRNVLCNCAYESWLLQQSQV